MPSLERLSTGGQDGADHWNLESPITFEAIFESMFVINDHICDGHPMVYVSSQEAEKAD